MRCDEFLERFDLLADAEAGAPALEPDAIASLRAHANACEACRGEVELARELSRAVKALPAIGAAAVAPSFPAASQERSRRWRRAAELAGFAAVIAVVALAVLSGTKDPRRGEPRTAVNDATAPVIHSQEAADEAKRLVEAAQTEPGARQDVLARLQRDPGLAPSFMALAREAQRQFETAHSRGDLTSMLDSTQLLETMDSLLLGAASPAARSSPEYQVFLMNGFWLGYTLFALGDFEAAKTTLRDCIDRIDLIERENGALDQVTKIYRDFRAKDVLEFLETRAGKPPSVDFDLGESWVTPRQFRLADCRGKVVAVVFRTAGNERAGAFLRPIAAFCADRAELRAVTISYYGHNSPEADQRAALRDDLESLGFDGPAGFDPDGQGYRIFRAFHAAVGTATFFILNKRGELVWYMPDPRGIDVTLAETLLLRYAAE